MTLNDLKFPVGPHVANKNPSDTLLKEWITEIESFPTKLYQLCAELDVEKLNLIYRPGGWTIKQVVHHCADSHSNALIRFKLALTEEQPTIKPYMEALWAELPDATNDDITHSLVMITAIHTKLTLLLKSLTDREYERTFIHPEHGKIFTLKETVWNYAWHCKHHYQHIVNALKFNGVFPELLS